MKSKWSAKVIAFVLICSFVSVSLFGVACVQLYAKYNDEIDISGKIFTKK